MIDDSWWLFWAHFNGTCLTHPLDSNTTNGKSKELSIEMTECIFNKSGKFQFQEMSKQAQVPGSTVQTTVCKYKVYGTVVSLPRSGIKTQTITCCWEKKIAQDGQESTKNHQTASQQWIGSCWETGDRCPQSSVFYIIMSWEAASYLQPQHLKARLKFAADHMYKEKACWRKTLVRWNKNWAVWSQWAAICLEAKMWGLSPQEQHTCQSWYW